uniref:Reverse transcriptase domain-containing protein n=1 Tax=Tanacetum cinerariifolium TaxID=118510 RepID=A0A699GMI5_TANCI|nr:reverse transcriptase domain-containing protein [Tanacetum cinerariifolium]
MSTHLSARNLFAPLDNPELTIRRRSRADPTLLNDFEMAAEGNGDPPVPDLRTMEELCQPSFNGRGRPIAPIAIQETNFGLKNDMIQQVQNSCQFHGLPGDDANKNLEKFLHVTQSIKVNGVTDDAHRLYLFPHSLTHHSTTWFDRLPRNSINTFERMAKMFLGKYFPPSMVKKLRNEITNFRQRPNESLFEAWERYKLSINRCSNHNMLPITQIDTFYNGLTLRHRDTINAAAGGTFMKRCLEECYDLIENMTTHHNDWDTSAQRSESPSSITSSFDPKIVAWKAKIAEINKNLMRVLQPPLAKPRTCMLREPIKVVIPTNLKVTKNTVHPTNNRSTKDVQPPVIQLETPIQNSEPVVASIIEPVVAPANDQKEKFFQLFQDLNFNISFADALILMPKFGPTIKTLLTNKYKLPELARTPLNEHCSTVLLKKLPEKLGDPGKFLIPCYFSGMDECLALADLSASINLMPLSVWNKLSLLELSPTCMTLELADRSISRPVGVAKDVFVKVGTFHFSVDFVVVDFNADPRVPLILRRSFLKTERALIDVFEGELTLRVGKEAITFNLDQTSIYSTNYNDIMANRIDVIDMACEEYSQEVLGFSDVIASGNPTPYYNPIVSTSSPTLTPFGDSDFLLGEGDILLLKAFLNDDPLLPPPTQGNYLPQVRKELKICEAKNCKSSIDEPPEVELKDLPPHLEYAFLEGDDKFPVIIPKDLSVEEKITLIKVLKSHKRAIAWKLSDIKGINLEFCTRKILMDKDFKLAVMQCTGHVPKVYDGYLSCHDRKTMEVFMEDFSVFGNSFESCLSHLKKMLKRCEDTNLCLNWEKSHFMFKEGIVLGHKISKNGIEVDKAKVDVIAKLPHPTAVKGIRSFLDHAGFYRRFIQDFSKIARPMTRLLEKDTSFFFSKECVKAFQTLKRKLTGAPILIAPNWDISFELMCDASDFAIVDTKGAENLAADHLSRLENPHQNVLDPKEINEAFPLETLNMGIDFMGLFPSSRGNKCILVAVDYLSKWVEAKALLTNDARVVYKFLKSLFARFGTPRAIISDHETHFCNDHFAKVMIKYGVTHRLATAYHLQTSGAGGIFKPWFKKNLRKDSGRERAFWSDKLDDALWAFRTAYKTPIGCTPYKLVYGKACHLPIELEYKAYWALKYTNFDLQIAGDHKKVQLNELNKLRDQAYENSLIYKEKTKRLHDSKIKDRVFNVGDRVLLFNSRLKIFSCKLKTRGSGPFTITHVFPYGTVELSQTDRPNFKVNGHRLKHYFGEDIPKMVVPNLQTFPKDK